ncbi:MAG TPA: DUF2382 domain-containing protein [Verrucomicrobiales bacterium]|nr:DUF2382 domain-containing protein [Verrucomicrobiales bacterium]
MNSTELFDYTVYDRNDEKVGKIENIWKDASGSIQFIGVSTGWLGLGQNHIIPARGMTVDSSKETVRVPCDEDTIKASPSYDHTTDLSDMEEARLYRHYGLEAGTYDAACACGTEKSARSSVAAATGNPVEVPLARETIQVGKREEKLGEVRLRKVVRTEVVNQPVELRREEVVVERVSGGGKTPGSEAFVEQVVSIPVSEEKAVVQKTVQSAGAVKATKKATSRSETVSDTVRKEEVEVERELASR